MDARVYEVARTVHLERLAETEGVTLLFRNRKYDFDEELAARLPVRQAGRGAIATQLLRKRYRIVELAEPLYIGALPSTALYLAALWLAKWLTRRRIRVVTYAIENVPLAEQLAGMKPLHRAAGSVIAAVARWSARQFDAVAFGTGASREAYAASGMGPQVLKESALFPAIEPVCAACDLPEQRGETLVFLGSFEPRKGLPELMAAWPDVYRRRPEARLTLVGKGPMLADVTAWVQQTTGTTLIVDPPRATIHAELSRAHVLLLPSRPMPRWREQIGLPILEGLSHGCEIVTTDQSGVAGWLADHGHQIVAEPVTPQRLADAIIASLTATRPASAIIGDLPGKSGRLMAEDWMWSRPAP